MRKSFMESGAYHKTRGGEQQQQAMLEVDLEDLQNNP